MKIHIVDTPFYCEYRYDASAYPGGDWRCKMNGIKCANIMQFPPKCPLTEVPDAEAELKTLIQKGGKG